MEKLFLLILPFLFTCTFNGTNSASEEKSNSMENQEPTVYYFIRHAEKDTTNPSNRDPELTEAGINRSENWTIVFKDIDFDLIYSSNYKRTRSTAQRIADSQQKEVNIYDASKLNDLDFQQKTKGKKVLVVGHSNTNPAFVNYILEEKKYADIPEDESGSLFIVTVYPNGEKHSQVLYIN